MGKSLQDLGLKDEALPTAGQALADLPDFGTFREPPQPGSYRFRLPDDLSAIWDVYDTPAKTPPQRIRAIFDKDHPLVIVQSPGGKSNNEPFEVRMSNEERSRGKDKSIIASDMDYLLRALKVATKPANNKAYIDVMKQQAKKDFGADIRYSWKCSADRNIRVKDSAGNVQEVEGRKGCGTSFYQEDLPNGGKDAAGLVPTQIQCTCGAILRCFANLDNIRS
jgi:hypothetical protein